MKKLVAVLAVLAPALTLIPAAPALADTVCAPITVDGQPLFCADTQPVDDAVAEAELVAAEVAATPECVRVEPQSNGVTIFVPVMPVERIPSGDVCWGYKITITANTSSQPVHVPQVCVTTTGTCVGPFDNTVPVPDLAQPLQVCAETRAWWKVDGVWQDYQAGIILMPSLGCTSVPA